VKTPASALEFLDCFSNIIVVVNLYTFPFLQSVSPSILFETATLLSFHKQRYAYSKWVNQKRELNWEDISPSSLACL